MFVADRDNPVGVIRVLAALNVKNISSLNDHRFAPDCPDTEWIPVITGRGFIILSRDPRQLTRPDELSALLGSGARAIYLSRGFGQMNIWRQAIWHLRYWRKLEEFAETMQSGDIAIALVDGRIRKATSRDMRLRTHLKSRHSDAV